MAVASSIKSADEAPINAIDWCRGIASLAVICDHLRHVVFKDYALISTHNVVSNIFYFACGLGHESVIVFFVLSGLLVGGNGLKALLGRKFSQRKYWAARVSRIYTVLAPALLIGGAIDLVGSHVLSGMGLYNPDLVKHSTSITQLTPDNLSLSVLLLNLAMLGGIAAPHLGTNGPLWSLVYEWWYYVLFALFAAAMTQKGWRRVVFGALLVALALALPHGLVLWGAFWIVGVAIAFIPDVKIPGFGVVAGLGFLGALLLSRYLTRVEQHAHPSELMFFLHDGVVAVGFSALLYALKQLKSGGSSLVAKVGHILSESSFSNYVTHFPFMILVASALLSNSRYAYQGDFNAVGLSFYALLLASILAYCRIIYVVFEARTNMIRQLLLKIKF